MMSRGFALLQRADPRPSVRLVLPAALAAWSCFSLAALARPSQGHTAAGAVVGYGQSGRKVFAGRYVLRLREFDCRRCRPGQARFGGPGAFFKGIQERRRGGGRFFGRRRLAPAVLRADRKPEEQADDARQDDRAAPLAG